MWNIVNTVYSDQTGLDMATMKAIGVEQYGDAQNLISKAVPKQESPQGYDLLARVKACSVNPVDLKARAGI